MSDVKQPATENRAILTRQLERARLDYSRLMRSHPSALVLEAKANVIKKINRLKCEIQESQ